MTVVNLTVDETILGGTGAATSGRVTVDYFAGARPYVRVVGETVTLPKPVVVTYTDGELAAPLSLEPTGDVCAARIVIRSDTTGAQLRRYVTIPDTGPVDFGALVDVDPSLFTPVTPDELLRDWIENEISTRTIDRF